MVIFTDRRRCIGIQGEEYAIRYLSKNGFKVIDRNVRYKVGEIDIVAKRGKELHFIEVKTRKNKDFVQPLESLSKRQAARIRRAAEAFLLDTRNGVNESDQPICMFDLIGIDLTEDEPEIEMLVDVY